MKFTIKTLDQKNFKIEACGLKTVWDLKRKLFNSATTNLLPDRQQIIYAGRILKDNKLLSNYAIDERKFLLVMMRKSKKESPNMTDQAKPTNNNKSKGLTEKMTEIQETGQGDIAYTDSTDSSKKTTTVVSSKRRKQVPSRKTSTTLTKKKSLKIKQRTQAPLNKVKLVKVRNSKTSSATSSSQEEYIANKQWPTSTSSMESPVSQHSDRSQRQRRLKRKKRKPINKNKSVKTAISLLSTSKSLTKMKTSKIRANKNSKPKKTTQKECDEFVLRQIVAMGYNEDDVRRALIGSFNDPNEAVNYLIQQVQERIEQQSTNKKQQKQRQHKIKHCRIIEPGNSKKSNNTLAFLRHDRDFKSLRHLLRSRPNILQSVIKRIDASHPELSFLLKEHEDEFLQLLHECSDDSEDEQSSNSNNNRMHITPEEEKIITRLVRMGFKRQMVILAFIACDRNVEKAVDYLCRVGDIEI